LGLATGGGDLNTNVLLALVYKRGFEDIVRVNEVLCIRELKTLVA